MAIISGCIQFPAKSSESQIYIYLDSNKYGSENTYLEGRALYNFKPINDIYCFFNNSQVFNLKAGNIIQYYYMTNTDEVKFISKSFPSKISIIKLI